ncbi:MAG: S-layer homology domain-containing protein, partial [Eubacteriales bacterium]|nr:S-layer homology domain-containing protein [Eubacteriales bacterium]
MLAYDKGCRAGKVELDKAIVGKVKVGKAMVRKAMVGKAMVRKVIRSKVGSSEIIKFIVSMALVSIILMSNIVGAFSAGFRDVKDADWFAGNVFALVEKGVINGFPVSGTALYDFKPQDDVKVDAFVKMTVTALGHTSIKNGSGYWAEPFINKAKELGLVLSGEFVKYDRSITRAEMARIIVRAINEQYSTNLQEYTKLIPDYSSIGEQYKEYVLKAYSKGILTGYTDSTFRGNNTATRAEAATIIMRLLEPSARVLPVLPGGEDDMSGGDLYLYEIDAKKFMKVETPHPELIEHIRAGMGILNGTNYKVSYSRALNQVDLVVYASAEDLDKPVGEREIILEYIIYTKINPLSNVYLPYQISLYNTE